MTRLSLFALALSLFTAAPLAAQERPSIFPPMPRGHFDRHRAGTTLNPGAGVFLTWPSVYLADPHIVYVGPYAYVFYPGYGYVPYNNGLGLYPYLYGGYGLPQQQVPLQPPPQMNQPPAAPPKEKVPAKEPPKQDENDQLAQMHQLVRVGNKAFAGGQYENALKSYDRAQAAAPLEPQPAFHAAQAHLAMSNYHKAYAEIRRGLRWQPQWAEAPFNPRALYGEKSAAFQKHLAKLADAVEKNPNDDSLLFLLGYELWFDGKRDQADVLFRRAAALTLDRSHIDRFLQVKDKGIGG